MQQRPAWAWREYALLGVLEDSRDNIRSNIPHAWAGGAAMRSPSNW